MSEYQKSNPTHGQAVSSNDPSERKAEYSGTVISDSLAADSLRSGGDFSKGNPTGISGTKAASSNLTDGADAEGVQLYSSEKSVSDDAQESYGDGGSSKDSLGAGGVLDGDQETPRYTEGSTGEKRKGQYDSNDGPQPVEGFAEPGSSGDPGRLGLEKFIKQNAEDAGVFTGGGLGGSTEENKFEVLDEGAGVGGETSS